MIDYMSLSNKHPSSKLCIVMRPERPTVRNMSVLICSSWGDWEDGSPSWSLSRPRNVILWIIPSPDCLIISKQPELNCLNSAVITFVFNSLILSVSLNFSLWESQWGKNIYITGRMFLLRKTAASFLVLILDSSLLSSVLFLCAQTVVTCFMTDSLFLHRLHSHRTGKSKEQRNLRVRVFWDQSHKK